MLFLKLSLLALMPLAVSIGLYLLEKKTKFANFGSKKKQTLYGLIFGLLAILSTEFGQLLKIQINNGAILNCRDACALIAGLVFGAPAGLISGFMGGIHRYLAVYWGAGTYTQLACAISTIIAGIVGAFLRKFLFDDKKPSAFYALIIAFIVEVFHMLMVFLTNMGDVERAFAVVQDATLPMVLINGITVMLSVLVITLIGKEKLVKTDHNARTISAQFQRGLSITVLIAFILTSAFTTAMQFNIAENNTKNLLTVNIDDVKKDVEDAAYDGLKKEAEKIKDKIVDEGWESQTPEKLVELAENNDIAQISILDKDGNFVKSYDETLVGKNMHDFGQQATDFMDKINASSDGTYVQEYQPNAEKGEGHKYIGIALDKEKSLFVQVGYDAQGFQKFVDPLIVSSVQNRHIGNSGYLMVINSDWIIVASGTPKLNGDNSKVAKLIGEPAGEYKGLTQVKQNKELISHSLRIEKENYSYYLMYEEAESYYLVSLLPQAEANLIRDLTIYITVFMEIILFVSMFILIYLLVKKLVVDNIKKVNDSLAEITGGNLDVVVNVRANEEFASLSDDINTTVLALKHYIAEAAARIDKELEFAKAIQHSALPSVFPPYPDIKDFDIYALMDTAKEVGGDFYDFYFVGPNKFAFLVADVSGKGIPAAMFMMTAKTIIKGYAESGKDVNDVFTLTNKKLCENNDANMFVTAWMGIIDLDTGVVEYANAGHNPPLIKHKNGKFEYLDSKAGFVLAGMDMVKYKKQTLTLEKGDEIYLYTDGVTEATDSNEELYGEERLINHLNSLGKHTCKEICESVKGDVDKFVGEAPQFDDITMVSFKLNEFEEGVEELNITATLENIDRVTDFVNELLEKYDCPMKSQMQIDIAIDELFSNIARYAYNPEVGPATVRVQVEDEPLSVVITFIDKGVPYDPLAKADPDTTMSAEDREIGGLGIFMVKKTMDDISYEYKNGQNILKIKKHLQ